MVALIFVFIAAIFKAVQDTLQFHYYESIFKGRNPLYYNPLVSWKNKYSDVKTLKPKFFGATTIFSFVTDFWHLAQFFFLLFIFGAVVLHQPFTNIENKFLSILLDYSIIRVIFGLVFELFYSKILIRK